MATSTQLSRETLWQRFGDLWPVHHREFTALLVECRRHFDGDMDQLVILSVIGERTLTAERSAGLTYPEFVEGRRAAGISRRINTQSIAEYTGIPRETVRRKVNHLIDRGWVRRNEDRTLEVTKEAAVDLAPATQATFDYMLALGNVLVRMAGEARERLASEPREVSPFDKTGRGDCCP